MIDPVVFFALFKVFKLIWTFLDHLIYFFTGFSLTAGYKSLKYENSAQIVTILGRGNYSPNFRYNLENFILLHQQYVHPEWVLTDDTATLFGLSQTHAFFCVSTFDMLDVSQGPFIWLMQNTKAEKLIIMPLESFHRLADKLGDPKYKRVTIINNTARCGSTLLCQMLNNVPGLRVLSEPTSGQYFHLDYAAGKTSHAQYLRLLRSVYRLQVKPRNNPHDEHLILKLSYFHSCVIPLLKEMYPEIQLVFNSRDYKQSLVSFVKAIEAMPSFVNRFQYQRDYFLASMSFPYDDAKWWDWFQSWQGCRRYGLSTVEMLAVTFSGTLKEYLSTKELYIHTCLYEDLKTYPENEMQALFSAIGIDNRHVPLTLQGLNQDSQKGFMGKPGEYGAAIEDDLWAKVDLLWKEFGVPCRVNLPLEEYRKMIEL